MIRPLNVLDRLHARLLDIVDTGLPLITPSVRDADLVGLTHLRGEMIAAIDAYASYVEDHVRGAALADGDPARITLAEDIAHGSVRLRATYHSFAARWEHRNGIDNWPEYRLSAIVLLKRIREQIHSASRWHPPRVPPAYPVTQSARVIP